ncbi:MAG: hydrogenase maturation protease [Bacteroidetes bacterium]|nr:hydrogenase maturation protease [Bacteroidota bacterium]
METEKILVLGIGNDILTDDGIGPKLVRDLTNMKLNVEITFETAAVGGLELLEIVSGYSRIFMIDAIRTSGGKPGNVYFLSPDDFRETMHISNLHDINFFTALELGNKLNYPLPSEIMIIAVEIAEDLEFSEQLSPALQKRYPEILSKVSKFLLEALLFQKFKA